MNNNPIKRKTSFWSIIKQLYGEGILVFTAFLIGIPTFIFIPYWMGQLFYKITRFKSKGIVDYWLAGFITLSLLAVIIVILLMLINFIHKVIGSLIVANKITYLPTTKAELEALNINSFDEFDAFMLSFFKIHKKTLDTNSLWDLLSYKLASCYKLLPPPENNKHLTAYEKEKEKYITVRARILAGEIIYCQWTSDIEYMEALDSEA